MCVSMWKPTPLQRNIIIVIVLGVVIRYVLGFFFTYPRDVASWVVNSENFLMGGGLYGLPGHYYTPVWGYIMAVLTSIAAFAGIPLSQYVPEFSGSVSALPWYTSLPSIEFALLIKTFLFIVDILVAYAIFKIALLMKFLFFVFFLVAFSIFKIAILVNYDDRKAFIAMAFCFLCTLTIVISSIRVMFENVEILFLLFSLLMLLQKRPIVAGAMLGISLLVKPYGMFLGILMIGYAYAQTGSLKYTGRYIVSTALMGVVLMAPVIASGHLDEALTWLSVRAGNVTSGYNVTLLLMPVLVVASAVVAYLLAYLRLTDVRLMMSVGLVLTGAMMVMPGNIQYYLLLVPMALLMFSRWLIPLFALILLLSFYAGVSFTSWSGTLYVANGFWGWETIQGLGEYLYPFEHALDYDTEKSLTGYAAVLLPIAGLLYRARGRNVEA